MSENHISHRGLDAEWHATLGQLTGGLSPAVLATAYTDWWLHLIGSPEKQADLMKRALEVAPQVDPSDPRFDDPAWAGFP